jgi:hypothetical protein
VEIQLAARRMSIARIGAKIYFQALKDINCLHLGSFKNKILHPKHRKV